MIDRHLLNHLVCPVTKKGLLPATEKQLDRLNLAIQQGELYYQNGDKVTEKLQQALITQNKTLVYVIENDNPLLLEDKGIATAQIHNWKMI